MSLPDGSYAISRDAGDFFRVEFDDAGEVVHVYDRVTPEDMDEPDLVVQTAPPPRHDAGWGYDEPVRTVAGPEHKSDGFRTLGAALDGLNLSPQQPPPVEPAIAADSEPEQAQSKPAVEAPPRVEEELTPELRQGFQDELTFIQVLVTAARALGRRPKKETDKKGKPVELTSTQKALELIHSRALKVEGILRDVRQLLTDEDETRVAVVRSRIGSAHVEIERAVKSGAKFLVGDTFDNAWATRLEERWREIDQLVDNDSDAREFIKEGLATREDIIGRLQERLQSNGTDFMRGNDSDFGTALEEILADF